MRLSGTYFEPRSSRSSHASVSFSRGCASVFADGATVCRDVRVVRVQDKRYIHLKNGALVQLDQDPPQSMVGELFTRPSRVLGWLEAFTLRKAIVMVAIAVAIVSGYRIVFSTVIVPAAVKGFSPAWERQLGLSVYSQLDSVLFEASELPQPQIDRLGAEAERLALVNGITPVPQIKFHKSDYLGANAIALPGGPIVLTDELVVLLDDDGLVMAVVAHELAHVHERHSLERLFEVIGTIAIASALFGADEALVEEVVTAGIHVVSLGKSRALEREADLAALDYLEAAGLERNLLLGAMKKILASSCELEHKENFGACLEQEDDLTGWLSTHPAGAERLQYLDRES